MHTRNWLIVLLFGFVLGPGIAAETVTTPLRNFGLGELHTVVVSPDAKYLATAGQSGAFLWDFAQGTVLHHFEEHHSFISAVVFSPDGRILLTAGYDRLIRAWSVDTGEELRSFAGHQSDITQLAFAPNGLTFVSAGDNMARVWSLDTGELLQTVAVSGEFINAAVFTPDGTRVVTADSSPTNNVRLWDLASETPLRTFGEHRGRVWALGVAAGSRLVTAGDDGIVRLWDLETGVRIRSLMGATSIVWNLAAQSNSSTVIAGCLDGKVIAWDSESGQTLTTFTDESLASLSIVPGTNQVVTATRENLLRVRDLAGGATMRIIEGHSSSTTTGVAFSPDGRYVISGGTETATRLWNRTNAQPVRTFMGHGAGTSAAAFSSDGTRVLTTRGAPQPLAQLWNTETGQIEREFIGHTGWMLAAVFSADGTRIATSSTDETARLWNVATGAELRAFRHSGAWVRAVAVSLDGTLLASGGSDGVAHLWSTSNGQRLRSFQLNAGSVKAVAFSPITGELLVAWEDGFIRLFDPLTGGMKSEITSAAGFLNAAAFSPDGRFILGGEGWPSFAARLWDARTGNVLRAFAGHTSPVDSVAFNSAGTQILTGADRVRLWDITDLAARLETKRTPSGLELRWSLGGLEQAPTVNGPWQVVDDATSPQVVSVDQPAAFFRVQAMPAE